MASIAVIISTLLAAAVALGGQLVAPPQHNACPEGGFVASCVFRGFMFKDSNLGMYCMNLHTEIYGYNWTWLDLNECLGNNGGGLVPQDMGYYSDTCTNCKVANTTTLLLTCDCKKVGGTLHKSTVDLNEMIYNVDGAMGCCGNTGSKDWIGPPFESQP